MTGNAGQQGAGLVQAAGWEMRCTSGRSNKFYRVVLAGPAVVINWGRIGTAGGLKVHRLATESAARDRALELTSEKETRGYELVREPATFPAAAAIVDRAHSGGGTQEHTEAARDLIAVFLQVSDSEGNE
jgi:predicted DNA-binding WGR domain protein